MDCYWDQYLNQLFSSNSFTTVFLYELCLFHLYYCLFILVKFVRMIFKILFKIQIQEGQFEISYRRSSLISKEQNSLILLSLGSFFRFLVTWKILRIQMHFGSWENFDLKSIQFSTWSSVCVYKWWNFGIEKEQESETLEPGVMLDFMFALEMFIDRRKSDKLSVLVLENWEHWSFLSILNPFMIDQSMKVIYHGP